jgi:Short C-terminal domain
MIRRTRGLARTVGRTAVIAGTATAVSGRVARNQEARVAQSAQTADAAPPPPEPAPPPASEGPDVIDQLKRFAELRDQGILTEEEFAAQKAKLLGS